MSNRVNAGARLDRLPVGPFHTRVLWLVGLGMFFDSFDNTLSSSVLATMLHSGWSTLQLNSIFMSATFVGLTIGAGVDRNKFVTTSRVNLSLHGPSARRLTKSP
jgi:putative MFS transporter